MLEKVSAPSYDRMKKKVKKLEENVYSKEMKIEMLEEENKDLRERMNAIKALSSWSWYFNLW